MYPQKPEGPRFDDRLYPSVVNTFDDAYDVLSAGILGWGSEEDDVTSYVLGMSSEKEFVNDTFDYFYGGSHRIMSAAFLGMLWSPMFLDNPVIDYRVYYHLQEWGSAAQEIPISEESFVKIANTKAICDVASGWHHVLPTSVQDILEPYSVSAALIAKRWDLDEDTYVRLANPLHNQPTRTALALNINTPDRALIRLCEDREASIRGLVAQRSKLPPEAWWKLASDVSPEVRGYVSGNVAAPEEFKSIAGLVSL